MFIPAPIRAAAAAIGSYLDNPKLTQARKAVTVVIGLIVLAEVVGNA